MRLNVYVLSVEDRWDSEEIKLVTVSKRKLYKFIKQLKEHKSYKITTLSNGSNFVCEARFYNF